MAMRGAGVVAQSGNGQAIKVDLLSHGSPVLQHIVAAAQAPIHLARWNSIRRCTQNIRFYRGTQAGGRQV